MLTMPDWQKVYGPYTRKDGRKHVVVVTKDPATGATVSRQTISYPKYVVEGVLLETLPDDMTVDHIDRNFKNDCLSNYRVVDKPTHSREDARHRRKDLVACIECGVNFIPSSNQVNNWSRSKAGPFCSRSCTGRYGQRVQTTGNRVKRKVVDVEYYYLDKQLR